jgi:plasmid segregation protein ParM
MKPYLEEKNQKKLIERLKGRHEVAPGHFVTVRDVMVVPQPVGSYFDVSYSMGKEDDFKRSEMLVFDPGFFSVDWLYFSNLELQLDLCDTSTDATSMILQQVDRLLYDEFNHRVSASKLESLMQSGESNVRIGRQTVPLEAYIKKASESVGAQVMTDILGCIRSSERTIDVVILTGGGAEMYRSAVEKAFPDAEIIVPERSVESNARGFWYCGASE